MSVCLEYMLGISVVHAFDLCKLLEIFSIGTDELPEMSKAFCQNMET